MNANEQYEYMAELFYKETGLMAPGKDSPAAFGGVIDKNELIEKWRAWISNFYSELFKLHKSNANCIENN